MPERTVVVASPVGLHARPASLFSKAAGASGLDVTLTNAAGTSVNAASVLGVLSLSIGSGESVVVGSEGEGAQAVVDELAALLETDLDES